MVVVNALARLQPSLAQPQFGPAVGGVRYQVRAVAGQPQVVGYPMSEMDGSSMLQSHTPPRGHGETPPSKKQCGQEEGHREDRPEMSNQKTHLLLNTNMQTNQDAASTGLPSASHGPLVMAPAQRAGVVGVAVGLTMPP